MIILSEEEDAEIQCEKAITKAFEWSPNYLEAQLCLANLRLCQCRSDEARDIVRRSLSSWYIAPLESEDESNEAKEDHVKEKRFPMNDLEMPLFSQRLSTAKLCIELELYEEALNVLETLLAEDDGDAEIWYLFGWTYYLTQEFSMAKEYLLRASEVRVDEDRVGKGGGETIGYQEVILSGCD
jgi:tetratricopeptide (TPR) repeat protein